MPHKNSDDSEELQHLYESALKASISKPIKKNMVNDHEEI
jgi:hypothetical protein